MSEQIAIYVHLPWCVRKCPYCDFNSHVRPDNMPETEYVAALLADLEGDLDLAAGREVASVFLGGGTPSLFDVDRKSTRLNSSHSQISYAVFCLKKKKNTAY